MLYKHYLQKKCEPPSKSIGIQHNGGKPNRKSHKTQTKPSLCHKGRYNVDISTCVLRYVNHLYCVPFKKGTEQKN